MKILSTLLFDQFLIEANLINGKEPYNGVSLEQFISSYTNNLATPEGAQMFTKKLSRLLMADERFLYAVRELPQNAPAWAQSAMEKGDLVYFNPSDELKDVVENISHYVAALEQDMVSTDGNTKANATRDFQGFAKAATLELLTQKVQEYFAKDAKKQEVTNAEGMTKVLEAPGGFAWYVLETPAAFYREGTTLKNCIGRVYTAESTKRTDTKIYVLRDRSNRSVVATRIVGKEMAEVKGSNNEPPIPRYMPAVQKLINTFNITLGAGGKNDVGNSGYYYHEGILYSRTQAVAKLIDVKKLFDIPGTTMNVARVVSANDELIRSIYLRPENRYYMDDPQVFEVRASDNDPVVSIVTSKSVAQFIARFDAYKSVTEAAEPASTPQQHVTSLALQMLVQKGYIKDISPDVLKNLFWQDKAVWNKETKTFSYTAPEKQHKPATKGAHTLDVYTGAQAKTLVKQLQPPPSRYMDEEAIEFQTPSENVKAVYTATVRKATGEVNRTTDKILVVVEYTNGQTSLYSVRGSNIDSKQTGYTRQGARWSSEFVRDGKTVTTLIALANEQGFRLPTRFTVAHGLSHANGQYIPLAALEPTEVPGNPPAVVFDLRELDPMDKATVIVRAISENDTKPHTSPLIGRFKFRGVTAGIQGILSDRDYDYYKDQDRLNKDVDRWTREVFGVPITAIYRVTIAYGTDKGGKVSLAAVGKEIHHIDTETLDHTWQARDDYQKVSDQLNAFAGNHGLVYVKQATSKSPQLRVQNGKIVPAEVVARTKLEKRLQRDTGLTGRVGVMTFSDGYTAKKMSEQDYGTWAAHGIQKTSQGTPWEIADADGNVKAIVLVTRSGEVQRMYSNPSGVEGSGRTMEVNGRQLPVVSAVDASVLGHVKRMASEFKWTGAGSQFTISKSDRLGKLLIRAYDRGSASIHRIGIRDQPGHYESSSDFYKFGAPLVKAGLMTRDTPAYHEYNDTLELTSKGRAVARKLRDGEEVSLPSMATMVDLHADYEHPPEPAPEERTPRPPREPGEPGEPGEAVQRAPRQRMEGGGSKADLALQRFREMVAANDGEMPTRSAFIAVLTQPPFNMTPAGASTYQYNTKAKYMRDQGAVNERLSFIDFLTYIV